MRPNRPSKYFSTFPIASLLDVVMTIVKFGSGASKIEEIVRNELEPMIDKMPNDDNNIGGGGWKFNLDDAPQSNTDPQ